VILRMSVARNHAAGFDPAPSSHDSRCCYSRDYS